MVINKVRDKLGSLCIICSLLQVQFSLDKYIMAINLFLGKYTFCYFHAPAVRVCELLYNSYLWVQASEDVHPGLFHHSKQFMVVLKQYD